MDKRSILAAVLIALVIIATPLIFPNQQRPARPTAAGADTTRRTAGTAGATTTPAASAPAAPTATVGAAPVAGGADSTGAPTAPTAAAPETTLVSTPLTQYRFSSIGAAPVGASMTRFAALDSAGGKVELVRPGEPMLRYGLVVPGDTVALDRVPFTVQQSTTPTGATVLDYAASLSEANVRIRYTFVPDSYVERVQTTATPTGTVPAYLLVSLPSGLQSAEADSVEDQRHYAYAVKPRREGARGVTFGSLDPGERELVRGPLTWAAAKSKYFIVGLLTPEDGPHFEEIDVRGGPRTGKTASQAQATVVAPLKGGSFAFELYAGPQEWKRLVALGRDFENSNPYGGFLQGIVQPFATIVMRILLWMKATTNLSYGWVLVIFGVAVRLLLWPLNQSAMRTSIKMQRVQPQLAELQKKHKADPQKLQSEMMRVYKEHDMSPFSAFSGCLPMLLPMPVLFALFFVFQNTIEFRGVPFLWLSDISLKDPFYILPILMGLSMYVLSWIGMRNAPPNPQAKMMMYMFPVMMTVFLLNMASGLNLYYAVQNLAALPQQWMIANERAKAGAGAGTAPAAPAAAKPRARAPRSV